MGYLNLWRSIREYLLAVLGAYQSFVLGLVFGVAGAIGLFTSGQGGIRVLALIGVALGFLVAPFQAFHRIRRQRDEARSNDQFHPFRGYRYANALSFTSWLIDSSPWPLNEPAMAVHAIAASSSPARHDGELDSEFADRVCQLASLRYCKKPRTVRGVRPRS